MTSSVVLVGVFTAVATLLAINGSISDDSFIRTQDVPTPTVENNKPIIGILAQPPEGDDCPSDKTYDTYLAASYVKFAEMAGIRVVPISYDIPREQLTSLLDQLNGVIFPGGGTMLIQGDSYTPYFSVESYIFETAKQKNDQGIHFPILGTCLGFQSLILLPMEKQFLDICAAQESVINQTLVNRDTTRTYAQAPESLVESIETKKITYENHIGCVTTGHYSQDPKLSAFFVPTATAVDHKGMEYINSIEARDYPFYGFQFHTEKNPFEWTTQTAIPHSMEAIKYTQYLADLFGTEVRKNNQHFTNQQEEDGALIYNYQPFFRNTYFEQTYCFEKSQ
eukprot:CAMPEP_0115010298 /NCGR_PEP_ID=MMETSP0216-20121206/23222_1 /TAXON_ID=223996 /ORGANISM="Protocruzia adherens, Strain Boccale" /LENGTH=336 /DNA_ID=CAMNT_0002378465 /DNA_START=15 /DNA_END=1025 /DNA_ORIENTATION=+